MFDGQRVVPTPDTQMSLLWWQIFSRPYMNRALEKRGQTIGVNDLHIAAHARSEGLTLVSNNRREFERVEALQLDIWVI